MAKTINVIIYPQFTQKDLIQMLQLRPGERYVTENGYVASMTHRHDDIEIEIEEKDYEVEE
jgi:hypothetical protein